MHIKAILAATFMSLAAPNLASASEVSLPGASITLSAISTGVSFIYAGTLTNTDTISLTETGLACLQGSSYCTNGAGVIVTAGSNPVGGSLTNGNATYGSLLLTISGVGTQQLFQTNSLNGLGTTTPPATLILPSISLGSLGYGTFSVANPTLTLMISDTLRGDNSGSFTLTQAARVPEPGTILLVGAGLAALGVVRRRKLA